MQSERYEDKSMQQKHIDRGKDFVASIMKDIVDIPGNMGMRLMRQVASLETGRQRDVVIRNITQPFWEECIMQVTRAGMRVRVCAVGTPGIGKTTSTSFLIRMLLLEKHTVVYRLLSRTYFWEFKWKNNDYDVQVHRGKDLEDIESLDDERTYYIVDPGTNKKDSCLPEPCINARTIIVSSPNELHWGSGEFEKQRDDVLGTFRYYPMWKLGELKEALQYLTELSEEEVVRRFRLVGGVPRYIFLHEDFFAPVLRSQNDAIEALTAMQAQQIVEGKLDILGTFGAQQPKSALIGYTEAETQGMFPFSCRHVEIVSPSVEDKIVAKFMGDLWRRMLQEDAVGWKVFEIYCRTLMATPHIRPFLGRLCCGYSYFDYYHELDFQLGGCSNVRLGLDIANAAMYGDAMTLFHSIDPNQFLFDFIYKDLNGTLHAFQVTLGKTHRLQRTLIQRLRRIIGDSSLVLYYLVPAESFVFFVTNPVYPEPDAHTSVWHICIPNPNTEKFSSS